ncbi:MAG: hypothetical protein J0M12_12985, partial [Deltaproteobacteria bacterium]|nr:hypothetical protein [Deltaproteobacteria bacterium]
MGKNLSWKYEWVDSESQLAAVAEAVRTEEFVAIDTETAGWETGNERLCLIQIGLPTR